ncbi:hypothetical protein KFL_001920130 [Klebsormidium nitens]|uniref:Uncharacterized protein n=1 Tax=Klebsormidium nitens TaxID=105231 RepID=A0A1Y1I208_KLENI|nr:hypothetical protein KFL_001920130 [Klebsormidium nitens]|eukprot:GAQ84513.1 hypothetical protein KFL_001920130 [Klebsormidium nitens]
MGRLSKVALVFSLFALICALVGSASSSSGPVFARLTLPEPSLVNSFLMNNATDWTNPLFGLEDSRPLQVIKCLPKLEKMKHTFGPAYEFYQVQAPETACNFPPPLETVVRHNHVAFFEYWASFIAFHASSAIAVFFTAVIVGSPSSLGNLIDGRWNAIPPEEVSAPDLEAPASETLQGRVGSDAIEDPVQDLEQGPEIQGRLKSVSSPAFATHAAMEEIFPKTTVERVGPVALPDPSQGLNQFLQEMDASLSLELCVTPKMSFYVGFPDNCGRLGDPYGGVEASVKTGPSKSKSFFIAWLKEVVYLHLYLAGFCFVLLSIAGNVALALVILGVYRSDQLMEVASALRAELIEEKDRFEAEMKRGNQSNAR